MNQRADQPSLRTVIPAEQIQKRVREMARQISDDYRGKTLHALAVLENGFMFMADLVRELEVEVICQFIKPRYKQLPAAGAADFLEIFFSHDGDVGGRHVLLVEGLVHTGIPDDFLMGDLRGRGAASVKLAALLDRQAARRVQLQPDYFGFLVDEKYLVGYGLGQPGQTQRNLPFLATSSQVAPVT